MDPQALREVIDPVAAGVHPGKMLARLDMQIAVVEKAWRMRRRRRPGRQCWGFADGIAAHSKSPTLIIGDQHDEIGRSILRRP